MKKLQEWTPDTMPGTTIIQEVDYTDPQNPVVSFKEFKVKGVECDAHNASDDAELHDKILAENQSKNRVLKQIMDVAPDLVEEVDDNKVFKKGCEPLWSFDKDRKLEVILPDNHGVDTAALSSDVALKKDIASEVIFK